MIEVVHFEEMTEDQFKQYLYNFFFTRTQSEEKSHQLLSLFEYATKEEMLNRNFDFERAGLPYTLANGLYTALHPDDDVEYLEDSYQWTQGESVKSFFPSHMTHIEEIPRLDDLESKLRQFIDENRLIHLTGRRRIGKTFTLMKIANSLTNEGRLVLFFTVPEVTLNIEHILHEFDPSLPVPRDSRELSILIAALVRGGVTVIIDEFQRLEHIQNYGNIISDLQEKIDYKFFHERKAAFIVAGSHITEMNHFISASRGLFNRGFSAIKAHPLPAKSIFNYLRNVRRLSWRDSVTLYTAFDGITGLYEDFFSLLIPLEINAQNLIEYLSTNYDECSNDYRETLGEDLALVLRAISLGRSKTRFQLREKVMSRCNIKKSRMETYIIQLAKYNFIQTVQNFVVTVPYPNQKLPRVTDLVIISDYPLLSCLKENIDQHGVFTNEGFVIEDIARSWIIQYLRFNDFCSENARVVDLAWMENFTEIDVVVVDDSLSRVFWGSCKRTFSRQNTKKHFGHIFSFYNNRGFSDCEWYRYTQYLMFISPEIESDTQETIEKFYLEFDHTNVENMIDAARLLSGHNNEQKHVSFQLLQTLETFDVEIAQNVLCIGFEEMLSVLDKLHKSSTVDEVKQWLSSFREGLFLKFEDLTHLNGAELLRLQVDDFLMLKNNDTDQEMNLEQASDLYRILHENNH